jgi:sterol 3beta-glucosyltransferase
MTGRAGPRAMSDLARHAVAKVGARAVFIAGADAETLETDDVLLPVASIAHDVLFPKVQAIVHHGGAGTTGAAFQSGVPAQIVPVTVDQPFWGRLSHALGVAPPPLDCRQLTVDGLAGGLDAALNDPGIRSRASQLGLRIRAEDGVAAAVDILTRSTIRMPQ